MQIGKARITKKGSIKMLKDKNLELMLFDDLLKPAMFNNIPYEDLPNTIREVIETKPNLSIKDIM